MAESHNTIYPRLEITTMEHNFFLFRNPQKEISCPRITACGGRVGRTQSSDAPESFVRTSSGKTHSRQAFIAQERADPFEHSPLLQHIFDASYPLLQDSRRREVRRIPTHGRGSQIRSHTPGASGNMSSTHKRAVGDTAFRYFPIRTLLTVSPPMGFNRLRDNSLTPRQSEAPGNTSNVVRIYTGALYLMTELKGSCGFWRGLRAPKPVLWEEFKDFVRRISEYLDISA